MIPDEFHETGRIFTISKKKVAVKEGLSETAKMTLQESIKPDQGVTLFELPEAKKTMGKKNSSMRAPELTTKLQGGAQFQVLKKGKPFEAKVSHGESPRMTREDYFKYAESQ